MYLLICCLLDFAQTTENQSLPNTMDALQQHLLTSEMIQQLGKGFLQNLPSLIPRLESSILKDVEYTCLKDIERLMLDTVQLKMYALQFLDAEGKLPPGVFQGGRHWVGDYQKCHSIQSDFNNATNHRFNGKYFTVSVQFNSGPLKALQVIFIGLCLPDSCHTIDAKALAESVLRAIGTTVASVPFVVDDNNKEFDGPAITLFAITGTIGLLVLLGTVVELLAPYMHGKELFSNRTSNFGRIDDISTENIHDHPNGIAIQHTIGEIKQNKLVAFLICFSFANNTKKLLKTKTAKGPLACLNGLRVVSMWWVIQGHTYEFSVLNTNNALYATETLRSRFTFQAIANGAFSVDTFFFLSGLLVAYLTVKELNDKGKMNWVYYFCHRYWRLTPLYGFTLLIFLVFFSYLPAGPFSWFTSNPLGPGYHAVDSCRSYWWTILIYINNFYPEYGSTGECMGWGWYLANDMQFYIFISPVLILLYSYRKRLGTILAVALILSCVIIRAVLVSHYEIHGWAGASKHKDDPWGQHGPLYVRPWARMSTYIVGMLTGFLLHHNNCRIRMGKLKVMIGWCVATGSALAVLYGLYEYKSDGSTMTMVASGFYVSLSRTIWSISLSWLVIACASGYGGPVNFVLSWKLWAPLGRLTFAAYLIHPIISIGYQMMLMTPIHFTDLTLIYMFVANLVFSYLFGYLVSMLVEAPMMGLEKLLLGRENTKKKSKVAETPVISATEYSVKF